ncbi:putative pyrroloquinoline-quinone binding quinoprotein [Dongia mobilis]|uniref:Putative pyrroloquinoline-quinone binding quinoprotein n=2 Tax=Dongia mobilis TaxID=578943 RepID=A0A4V3DDR3_9PROT|nr:putative pyrroloquinoline-quinone binding quinoprotein [Dongia mobilis]
MRHMRYLAILACLGMTVPASTPAYPQNAVFDAIGSHILENVVYAQAQLRVTAPLMQLTGLSVGTGGDSFVLLGSDGAYRLWNLQAGSQRATLKPGAGTAFAPSASGTTLLVGGSDGGVRLIDPPSGKAFATLAGADGAVTALAGSSDDALVYAGTAKGGVIAWNVDDGRIAWQSTALSGAVQHIAVSPDNRHLAIADAAGNLARLDAVGGTAATAGTLGSPASALHVNDKGGVIALASSGRLARNEGSLDIGPVARADIGFSGANAVVLRQDGTVELVDARTGKKIHKIAGTKGSKIGLIYDEAAAKAIVVAADGTLEVFDTVTRELVLSIFISTQGWALIDRQGRFDGSSSGLRGIEWAVKKSNFPITSLTEAFADPGMLSAVLQNDQRDLRAVPGSPVEQFPLPPKVEIESLTAEKTGDKPYQLLVIAEDQGGGIKDVRLYHNGKIVDVGAILEQKDAEAGGKRIRVVGYNVWPVPGPNVFQAVATGAYDNTGDAAELHETFSGEPRRGRLNLIAVGVSKYGRLPQQYQLQVAANDAQRVATAVSQHARSLFTEIAGSELTDARATRQQIIGALDSLKTAKPEDSVILFLSGHGVTDGEEWYFLPHDATADDPGTWLSATDIRAALEKSGAQRVFVIIDACYSGGTVENFYAVTSFQKRFLTNGLRSSGIQVLTATRRDQLAPESAELGAGFLTYLVDQAIAGRADADPRDGWISSQEVAKFAYQALPELFLTQREKNPKAFRDVYGADVQEPDVYTIGADLLIAQTGQ